MGHHECEPAAPGSRRGVPFDQYAKCICVRRCAPCSISSTTLISTAAGTPTPRCHGPCLFPLAGPRQEPLERSLVEEGESLPVGLNAGAKHGRRDDHDRRRQHLRRERAGGKDRKTRAVTAEEITDVPPYLGAPDRASQ